MFSSLVQVFIRRKHPKTSTSNSRTLGTNLQALIDSLDTPALPNAEINLVLSNRKAAYGLTRAAQANPPIPTAYLALQPYLKQNPDKTREDYDAEIARIVLHAKPDIVVLAGWMHILSDAFLDILNGKRKPIGGDEPLVTIPIPVINLHPALPGQFDGANAIERAHEAFKKGEITKSGAMIHRVVRDVDKGEPVIVQEVVFIEGESLEAYEARLHDIEHEIIVQATKKVLDEGKTVSVSIFFGDCFGWRFNRFLGLLTCCNIPLAAYSMFRAEAQNLSGLASSLHNYSAWTN